MGSPLGPARAARESAPMLACCVRRSPDDDVSATSLPGERRPIAPHAVALAHPHQALSLCHSGAARVTRGPPDRCRLGNALGRCAAWRQAAAATVAGPAARLHGTSGIGPERGRRRRPASESPVAPRYGRGARAGPSLAPAAAAAARGRSRREDGRPARAAVVGSATPRARPQPQLPRHTPPLTTVRAQQSACCCHAAALLAATRRPRPLSPFSRGWPYGALVASIFKSCMVLVQIGVSANYPPPAREARVCRENDTLSISRALSWSRCF